MKVLAFIYNYLFVRPKWIKTARRKLRTSKDPRKEMLPTSIAIMSSRKPLVKKYKLEAYKNYYKYAYEQHFKRLDSTIAHLKQYKITPFHKEG